MLVLITFAKTVTHYLGNVEYKYSGSDVKIKRHIGGLIIESTSHQNNRSTWTFNHLLKDHLGSTHTVVNKQGQSIQRFSFNAWGERRQPAAVISNGAIFNVIPIGSVWNNLGQDIEETTNRGFTGHEHFDQVGIIHMNGRIYDPTIGRFLQADPIIQDPYNTQSLNRYSYVMNNPLSFTDPSGYSRMRKGWWRAPLSYMAMFIPLPGINLWAAAIIRGALSGAIATGNLKGAVKGALQAAVTYGIAHGNKGAGWVSKGGPGRAIAHAAVAGVSAEVDGGKFGHGFASSFLSSGADHVGLNNFKNPVARTLSNAIVAGTISELMGGKFANGAQSAAFRVAFNDFGEMFNKWWNGQKADATMEEKIKAPTSSQLGNAAVKQYLKPIHSPVQHTADLVLDKANLEVAGINGAATADGFFYVIGGAVDFVYYEGCTTVSVCGQVGAGFQYGVSSSTGIEFGTGEKYTDNVAVGIFGDWGLGGTFGHSVDIGFPSLKPVYKVDKGIGAGSAGGVQVCFTVSKSCW